nr:alpha/beta hydrolase [Maliibacterium massiliense]
MFIQARGVRVHIEEKGTGEPVLFLHGWGGCIDSFAPVINHVSQTRRAIALDFPGFGQSDEPPQPWDVTEYMALTAEIIRTLDIAPCKIICHSFGGRVAILLAATYPDLVGKMVFSDAAGLIPKRSLSYKIKVRTFKLMKKLAQRPWIVKALKALGIDLQKKIAARGSSDYKALSGVMRPTFVKVISQDLRPQLARIQSSVVLVWGAEDTDTPLSFGKIMAEEIPDAGLIVFEGAGHFAYLDQPGRFLAIVDSFFGGKDA